MHVILLFKLKSLMIQRCTFNKTHYGGMNGNTGCPAGYGSTAS